MKVHYTFTAPIHIFTFVDNSRQAANDYMSLAEQEIIRWVQAGYVDKPFCILLDISTSGLFPLKYTIQRSTSILDNYEKLPQRYIAYLTDNQMDISLLKSIATTPQWNNTRRILPPAKRTDAIDWLLEVWGN
ncbi:MAG: hypothetical protein D6711_16150 [Chloroflexi bacterium]|nr:MAG: hypothetical protein D6711_16150 [Chloroflexota bacterium]